MLVGLAALAEVMLLFGAGRSGSLGGSDPSLLLFSACRSGCLGGGDPSLLG